MDEGRACPKCGAQNPSSATFCWQCYVSLQATAASTPAPAGLASRPGTAPVAGVPGVQAAPSPWPQPTGFPAPIQPAQRSGGPKIIGMVVGLLAAAAVAALLVGHLRGSHVSLPDSVAGYPKMSSPQLDQALDVLHHQIKTAGYEADAAFYGNQGTPRMALIWFRDRSGTDPQTAFGAFSSGFGSSGAGNIDTGSSTTETVEGVDYLCAPASAGVPAVFCMWKDGDIFWLVFDAQPGQDLSASRDLAVQAEHTIS